MNTLWRKQHFQLRVHRKKKPGKRTVTGNDMDDDGSEEDYEKQQKPSKIQKPYQSDVGLVQQEHEDEELYEDDSSFLVLQ